MTKNAFRIDMPFFDGSKIGYIPRDLAALWVPILDGGSLYTGWGSAHSAREKSITIDVYERVSLPLKGLKSISFREGGYGGCDLCVEISCSKRQIIWEEEMEPHSRRFTRKTLSFTEEQWENIVLQGLQKCNLPAWRNDYMDPGICDGTQWEMTICRRKKFRKQISGSNDFPEEWDIWHDFIESCLAREDIEKKEERNACKYF